MSEKEKDPFEISNYRSSKGRYIQVSSQSARAVYVLSSEMQDPLDDESLIFVETYLTVHRRLERPMQIHLGDREEIEALYTACKRYLQETKA